MTPRRQAAEPEPISAGLYAVRRSTPQPVTAGDRLRRTPCLVCGQPIGAGPAITVCLTHYTPDLPLAGGLPSTAWLMHATHRGVTTRQIHDLAEWRLGTTPHEGK